MLAAVPRPWQSGGAGVTWHGRRPARRGLRNTRHKPIPSPWKSTRPRSNRGVTTSAVFGFRACGWMKA